MGLLGKKKETCPACGYKFENHDEYVNHITNIHPETKTCTKCSGTAYWHVPGNGPHHGKELSYVCVECGFIVEVWRTRTLWDDDEYLEKKDRSKHYFK
jgi:DNA-directed RNA polymerase subunit RPC12/RpoP